MDDVILGLEKGIRRMGSPGGFSGLGGRHARGGPLRWVEETLTWWSSSLAPQEEAMAAAESRLLLSSSMVGGDRRCCVIAIEDRELT
jgi:hypothetical protein